MKKLLIAGAALVSFAGATYAADLPLKAPPPRVAVYLWDGFYAGVNVGYSWGRAETDPRVDARTQVFRAFGLPAQTLLLDTGPVALSAPGFTTNVDGWIGGFQAGWNSQHGSWLWGIEGDIQASGERGSSDVAIVFPALLVPGAGTIPGAIETVSAEYKLKWFGTLRGRVGILATERLLLYGTGGLAVGRLESNYIATIGGLGTLTSGTNTTNWGWVAGAGAEGALWDNWTAKIEYLYMDLGSFTGPGLAGTSIFPNVPGQGLTTVTSFVANSNVGFTDHILRVGLNYRFAPTR